MTEMKRRDFQILLAMAIVGTSSGCMADVKTSLRPVARTRAPEAEDRDAPLAQDMVGQLIIVGFAGTDPGDPGVEAVARQLGEGTIGGVLLLGRNVRSPEQLTRLTGYLASQNRAKPFIAIDQEGGKVQRLREPQGFQSWAAARDLHRTASGDLAAYYGPRAQALSRYGINFNFAPVVDMDTNRSNPIIGALGRSYSADPGAVAEFARAFVSAHRRAGVLTSLKHFPGHGSATQDSHLILPEVTTQWSRAELQPFQDLVTAGMADTVMMAHLYHPDFSDGQGIPSSLSVKAHRLLRSDLGFGGVVVTDDLQMKAILRRYSEEGAATAAIQAGSDLLVYATFERPDPTVGPRINAALVAAVESGAISRERLVQSYLRVTRLKDRL